MPSLIAAPLDFTQLPRRHSIVAALLSVHLLLICTRELCNCSLVSKLEALTVLGLHRFGNSRTTVLLAVVYIRLAMVIQVFSGPGDSILKTATLDLVELPWRRIPVVAALLSKLRKHSLNTQCIGWQDASGSQKKD